MTSIKSLTHTWSVLNNLIGEMEKAGIFIPDLTYGDLRNAKMVIEYLRSFGEEISGDRNADLTLQNEVEYKLEILKKSLLAWAEEARGQEYRRSWEKQFDDDIMLEGGFDTKETVPISDLPHEKDIGFFRIRLPDDIPVEVISEIAEDCEVLIHLDGDRHLQVSGKRACVRDAMKRIGELFYGKSRFEKI